MREKSRKWAFELEFACADRAEIPYTEIANLMAELVLTLKQKGFQMSRPAIRDVELEENKGR